MPETEALNLVSEARCFGGRQQTWQHAAESTGTPMKFGVYLPPQAETQTCPVVYWLSGLTCTEDNFITKAGAQRYAAELGLILVAPDTSPRGTDLPGEHDSWDFGSGAGFYVDATQAPWSAHYRMASYVSRELPDLVKAHFPVNDRQGISGHSMGGHGALVTALRHPGQYASVSAFAPIAAPTRCPWGQKAFGHYLGPDQSQWAAYDAHLLLAQAAHKQPMLVDQGAADNFLEQGQLLPELLEAAAREADYPLTMRYQPGYDHGYFFVSTFIGEHLAWHARQLHS